MVQINDIEQPRAWLYREIDGGETEYIGLITNYVQFLDVRVQIKENQESGYYMKMFNGEVVKFDVNGMPNHWPRGAFGDIETDLLLKLI